MYICVSTKTSTRLNEKTEKLEPIVTYQVHYEDTVEQQLELMALKDDRVANLRIWHMGVDEKGVPKIGTEVKP